MWSGWLAVIADAVREFCGSLSPVLERLKFCGSLVTVRSEKEVVETELAIMPSLVCVVLTVSIKEPERFVGEEFCAGSVGKISARPAPA